MSHHTIPTDTGSGGTMLSQSRDERRRLEREGLIQQQQHHHHHQAAAAQNQHMYEYGGTGHQGEMRGDTGATSPSVFDSIYEELDAGLHVVDASIPSDPGGAGRANYRTSSGAIGGGGSGRLGERGGAGGGVAATGNPAAASAKAGSNDPRKIYMRGGGGSGGQPSAAYHHHQQRTVHPSEAQAALAQVARARQVQMVQHQMQMQQQQMMLAQSESERYEPIALSHSVLQLQQRQAQGMGSSVRGRGNGRRGGGGNGGPHIDSLVMYGNDRDDMSENSGLSQQRLLKKRHGHRLGSSSAKNYPKRNPNKKSNVTILGMPDSFGGGGKGQRNHQSISANAVPTTTENAYERRLARERMRGLVRVGSSRTSNRGGGIGGGAGMGGYDGVESVDGESTSYAAPIPARQQQQQQSRQIPAQRDFADGQRGQHHHHHQQQQQQQQQTPWWEGFDTTDQPKSEEQPQQQQQRRVPRSDGSTDGHDGRGGYNFGSLPLPRSVASNDDSYEGMGDHAGSNSAMGAFPSPQTVTRGYDNGYPPAGATASANSGPKIVPKRRADRPFLAHSSSAGKIMEPIVEEEGATPPRGRDSWEQQDTSLAFHQQQQPSPLNRSGENLFNQYSINPVPNVPHRRNIGEGGGPSPRLGAPPAPTSYYDSPGPNDAAVGSSPSSYNDDPNIVVGQWESPEDDRWNDSRKDFSQDKYEAAAAAAAAAIAGENAFSPTSVAGEPAFGATNRRLNYEEANQESSSDVRAATPNSVLTDEMSNPVPRTMIRQRFSPDAEISQRPPRSSPQVSLSSGQITAVDSAAAVAPAPDPMSQSQEETDRAKRIEKAHAIRQRRVKEAREHGEDLLRSSPRLSAESSCDGGSGPLSPIDEIGMSRGEIAFQEDTEWEPDEKPPSKRDIQKGRASEDLKGRVIDLSPSSSKREKPKTPRITFQDAEFGFIEAVAAVVIQTFIRRYLAYKTATIRYEAALTVKDFIINATHARREAREQEEELEFAQRQAEVEAQKREILAKAHEQARMLSEADAAAIAEAENECLQEQGGDLEQQHEERAVPQYSSRANLSEDELAAIKIQAAFRGWWVRDCLSVDNYCATLIQQAVRGYLRRMQYEFDFYRIVIVQSAVRRFLAKRKALLAREGAEYVEVSLATEEEQTPRAAPRPASQKSWSVPAPSSIAATKGVPPRPEAKTQSFAKIAPVIIETGGGKGSLINAWKAREAQAKEQAAKPNIVYQSKSKVLESSTVEERRMVTNFANNVSATEIVETTKTHKSSVFTKTVQRVGPATNHQQQIKSAYSPGQNAAATKIQAQWRCFAAEMDYVRKLDCILLVQSLARRWVTMKLVLPYMIMARNGDFGEYNEGESYEEYGNGEEGQYYEVEEKKEVSDTAPSAGSVNNNSAMNIWKGREANATTMEPMIRTDTVKINTGAKGGGSNSVLQKWKQKEAEAIEKAKRPGGR